MSSRGELKAPKPLLEDRWALLLCAVVLGAAVWWVISWVGSSDRVPRQGGPGEEGAARTQETVGSTSAANPWQPLAGRWERPDGGYVLEVTLEGNGDVAKAAYYNPRPIYVSRTETGRDTDNRLRLFVELQDTGYPGCNYTLTYDATQDVLKGVYYQAAMQQSFDVVFTRLK